ncbi:MAG: hypothetical protein ACE5QF_04835 [Thermoplasmata archaeon]
MDSEPESNDKKRKWIRSTLLLLRDLGIAALIVGIILLSLYVYTGNWPPMVVVESQSMQHSDSESFVGVIDTGDLVLVQRAPSSGDIVTYVEGKASGHSTYGGYGDVIIYKENGNFQEKSIIHRALVRLVWNESSRTIDIPSLDNDKWVRNIDWSGRTFSGDDVTSPYGLDGIIQLNDVVFKGRTVMVEIWKYKDQFENLNWTGDAYVALGDNNSIPDPQIISQRWIEGRARGEIPWFGLLKLTLFKDPGAPCCARWGDPKAPQNSWDSLLISIILIVAVPIALDFGVSYALEVRRRRAELKEEACGADNEPEAEEGEPPPEEVEEEIEREDLEEPEIIEEIEEPEEPEAEPQEVTPEGSDEEEPAPEISDQGGLEP